MNHEFLYIASFGNTPTGYKGWFKITPFRRGEKNGGVDGLKTECSPSAKHVATYSIISPYNRRIAFYFLQ